MTGARSLRGAAPASAAEAGATIARQITASVAGQPVPGRIELHLDPPELGRVEIRLDIADQGLRALVQSERGTTADLLRRHGDILMGQLQDAGFSEIDLEFTGGDRPERQGHQLPDRPDSGLPRSEQPDNQPDASARPPLDHPSTTGGLDLRL